MVATDFLAEEVEVAVEVDGAIEMDSVDARDESFRVSALFFAFLDQYQYTMATMTMITMIQTLENVQSHLHMQLHCCSGVAVCKSVVSLP